jgi:hypothetical protein
VPTGHKGASVFNPFKNERVVTLRGQAWPNLAKIGKCNGRALAEEIQAPPINS